MSAFGKVDVLLGGKLQCFFAAAEDDFGELGAIDQHRSVQRMARRAALQIVANVVANGDLEAVGA